MHPQSAIWNRSRKQRLNHSDMLTKSSLRDYVGIMTGISGNTQYNTPQNKISMHWKKNKSYFQLLYHDIMMQRKLKAINTISLLLTIVSSLIAWPITTFFTPYKGTIILISISAFIMLYQGRQVPQPIVVKLDPVMLFTCGFLLKIQKKARSGSNVTQLQSNANGRSM